VIVGEGARKTVLERAAKVAGLRNVEFIGHRHPSAMSDVLAAGDLHLIPLTAGAAGCLVPSKVYGILAAGRPFVAMMERDAEVARLASEFEVGFVVPPGDASALARTISDSMRDRARLDDMGRRARALAEQQYDRRIITHRFAEFLKTMVPMRDEIVPLPVESVVTIPIK
jgi:glycosyltransferase involved in cell wall biosynthesis